MHPHTPAGKKSGRHFKAASDARTEGGGATAARAYCNPCRAAAEASLEHSVVHAGEVRGRWTTERVVVLKKLFEAMGPRCRTRVTNCSRVAASNRKEPLCWRVGVHYDRASTVAEGRVAGRGSSTSYCLPIRAAALYGTLYSGYTGMGPYLPQERFSHSPTHLMVALCPARYEAAASKGSSPLKIPARPVH